MILPHGITNTTLFALVEHNLPRLVGKTSIYSAYLCFVFCKLFFIVSVLFNKGAI